MIERFFVKKSIKAFKEVKQAYIDLKQSEKELKGE
jgi:hypothetical protein